MTEGQTTTTSTCSQPEFYTAVEKAIKKTGYAIESLDNLIPILPDDIDRWIFERYRGVLRCIQYQLMDMTCNEDLLQNFWTYAPSRNWTALRSKKHSE